MCAGAVAARAPARPRQVEAAVDDGPVRIVQVLQQLLRFDQRGMHATLRPRRAAVCILGAVRLSLQSHVHPPAAEERWQSRFTGAAAVPSRGGCCWRSSTSACPYVSHLLQFAKQEHKSPQMLAMNPRGRVPVLKDGDYVCFESLAILYYLDRKYPSRRSSAARRRRRGTIMRVICEYQAYIEQHIMSIARAVFNGQDLAADEVTAAMHAAGERGAHDRGAAVEVRLDRGRGLLGGRHGDLSRHPAAAARAGEAAGRSLSSRFLPVEVNYPALGRWLARVAALPGYERTYPPHWRSTDGGWRRRASEN